jgi:ankyrin repeat protein
MLHVCHLVFLLSLLLPSPAFCDITKYTAPRINDRTLIEAAKQGSRAGVISALLKGDDIDGTDIHGHTALVNALNHGHLNLVHLLVERGASIDIIDDDGYSPLMWATHKGHESEVEMLLEEGADPLVQNRDGFTALMMAAQENRVGIARLLLEHETAPHRTLHVGPRAHSVPTTTHGDTALSIAIREKNDRIASMIRETVAAEEAAAEEAAAGAAGDL